MYNDHFSQPPPAHMGIPPVHMDPKTGEFFHLGSTVQVMLTTLLALLRVQAPIMNQSNQLCVNY